MTAAECLDYCIERHRDEADGVAPPRLYLTLPSYCAMRSELVAHTFAWRSVPRGSWPLVGRWRGVDVVIGDGLAAL